MAFTLKQREAGFRKRILVVEDEALLALDTAEMLRAMGCVVVGIAATADDAVVQAGRLRPDVVLMDIRLKGGKDGIEAAAEIRAFHGCPLIFVTAQSDEAILSRARAANPAGFLFKPFAESDLFDILESLGCSTAAPDAKRLF